MLKSACLNDVASDLGSGQCLTVVTIVAGVV